MDWLLEDRWTIVGLGAFALLLLGVALVRTRRGALVAAMVLVVALTGLAVAVEWLVVTDREAALAALYEGAQAVRTGDEARVLALVAPEEEDLKNRVRHYLGLYDFPQVAINAPEAQILEGAQRTARIKFTARVTVKPKGGMDLSRNEILVPIEIRLRKEGDRWLVTSYQEDKWTPGPE
ncbi:MAG: hypothetical protein L0Z62_34565 [Gemmataceae bacterium]|nr:hypothetical protein [Gemmataceae bacterium]